MKGPTKKESEILSVRSEWMEWGSWFAGGLVVFGLTIEYGPEIQQAFRERRPPKPGTIGGILVIIGVFAEVVLSIFIAKIGRRIQAISEHAVAEANERAAQANRMAAEARLELEKLKTPRTLDIDQQEFITTALMPFAGTEFVLGVNFDPESLALAEALALCITNAGWKWNPLHDWGAPQRMSVGKSYAVLWARSGLTVGFRLPKVTSSEPAARALTAALEKVNLGPVTIDFITEADTGLSAIPLGAIILIVGSKPFPKQRPVTPPQA